MSERTQNSKITQSSHHEEFPETQSLDVVQDDRTTKSRKSEYQHINTLATEAARGDTAAFNILYDTLFPKVNAYFAKRVQDPAKEDLIGDTFECVTEGLLQGKWHDEGKPFEVWVIKTARNFYREWVRNQKKHAVEQRDPDFRYEDVEDDELPILDQVLQKEDEEILWDLASKLPKFQYLVLYERFKNNRAFKDIASILGKSEDNCRQANKRALASLRNMLIQSGLYNEYISLPPKGRGETL